MKTYDVTGLVNPTTVNADDCDGLLVADAKGTDREVNFCFGNVSQGCWVYVSAQVSAASEAAAVRMVEAVAKAVMTGGEDGDLDLNAEEADEDYGV